MLDLKEELYRPVRKLSLGQRMKSELLAALIHEPNILFLDEPTLGLDINAQRNLRAAGISTFIGEVKTEGAVKVGTGVTINTTTGLIVNSGGVKVTGIATFADELDAAQYEGNFILDSYLFT